MKHLSLPLLLIVIFADVYCWWYYDTKISDYIYYVGETWVYLLYTLSFLIFIKYPPTEFEKKFMVLLLWALAPFCANAIYRQMSGLGHEKSVIDLYSGFTSLLIVFIQIIVWWRKANRSK